MRVASLNLCIDQIVLELLPIDRIVLLSQLANDPKLSHFATRASGIQRYDGSVETILRLNPDIVLGGRFTATDTTQALTRFGYKVTLFDMPETLIGAQSLVLDVADKLGVRQAANISVAHMQTRLQMLVQEKKIANRPRALLYLPNGLSAGSDTLRGELIGIAGLINLAAEIGISGYGEVSLKTIVGLKPDLLLFDAAEQNLPSMAQKMLLHPALQRLELITVAIPTNTWICPGTMNVEAVEFLKNAMRYKLDG